MIIKGNALLYNVALLRSVELYFNRKPIVNNCGSSCFQLCWVVEFCLKYGCCIGGISWYFMDIGDWI